MTGHIAFDDMKPEPCPRCGRPVDDVYFPLHEESDNSRPYARGCTGCGLRGPLCANLASANFWWNNLAQLARRVDDLPVRNIPRDGAVPDRRDERPTERPRPHSLDGGRSEPFTARTAHASLVMRPPDMPCPFCGRESPAGAGAPVGETIRHYLVCMRCGAHGPRAASPEKAIEAWNRRCP